MTARRIGDADLEYIVAVDTDPQMQATLLGRLSSREESEARLQRWLEERRRTGLGFWLFFGDDGRPVGHGGLFASPRDYGFIELGYAILPERWGSGYATEMGRKLRSIARALELPPLIGMTRTTNVPSRRVLEKIGFDYDCDVRVSEIEYARYLERAT